MITWTIPLKLQAAIAYDIGLDKTCINLTWPGMHLFFDVAGKWNKQAITAAIHKLADDGLLPKADQLMEEVLKKEDL